MWLVRHVFSPAASIVGLLAAAVIAVIAIVVAIVAIHQAVLVE